MGTESNEQVTLSMIGHKGKAFYQKDENGRCYLKKLRKSKKDVLSYSKGSFKNEDIMFLWLSEDYLTEGLKKDAVDNKKMLVNSIIGESVKWIILIPVILWLMHFVG
ncbi:MAG: hypothetical protein J6N53_18050 [Lachnospiraceae bacterium]|nr:hypothetical protein [Lachnospiraceae bacterium]MBP3297639.1 hypothetical protein [Lachnospiraceae bacterium]